MEPAIDAAPLISQDEISFFVQGLAESLAAGNPGLVVAVFGSFRERRHPYPRDIDILLLDAGKVKLRSFELSLARLRSRLLSGDRDAGFPLHAGPLRGVVRSYITNYGATTFRPVPQFIFGPYHSAETFGAVRKVHLHFKGPITEQQLTLFCRIMPFHALSVIKSAEVLAGQFDAGKFLPLIHLDSVELQRWSDSLAIRSRRYDDVAELEKCISKLLLLHRLYFEWLGGSEEPQLFQARLLSQSLCADDCHFPDVISAREAFDHTMKSCRVLRDSIDV